MRSEKHVKLSFRRMKIIKRIFDCFNYSTISHLGREENFIHRPFPIEDRINDRKSRNQVFKIM